MARMIALRHSLTLHLAEDRAPEGGWRPRLGHWLRRLATRVDGDRSLRYRVETLPPLPASVTSRCLEAGIEHAADLIKEACRSEAIEGAMRVHKPGLYADELNDNQEGRP